MTTFRDLLARTEAQRFVGRDAEIALFERWLSADEPNTPILNVIGHAGVGKTAMLHEYARRARSVGRSVVEIDASSLRPGREDLLASLGGTTVAGAAAAVNATRPLIVVDGFDAPGGLAPFLLQELLPSFELEVRVIIAGRQRLLDDVDPGGPWRRLVTEVQLAAWDRSVALEYLDRRGLATHEMADDILRAASGHPLTMSMAADAAELGACHFGEAPDWRLSVRAIAEQVLLGVTDPALRAAIEAAAVTRRIDEGLLRRLLDEPLAEDTFDTLCRLSMMRPRDVGIGLHDDVRHVLADDLRWRAPDRYRELRMRALEEYRRRARSGDVAARRHALEDAFFLMEDSIVQAMLFGDEGSPGRIALEDVADHGGVDEVLELERVWHYEVLPAMGAAMSGPLYDTIDHMETFASLARHPDARLRLARDATGAGIGFSLVLPVAASTATVLDEHWWMGSTFRAFVRDEGGPDTLAPDAGLSDVYLIAQVMAFGDDATAATAALWRDLFGLFALEGAYLVTPAMEPHVQLMEDLGFEILDDTEFTGFSADYVAYGMLLDLRQRGVTDWVATKVLPLPPVPIEAAVDDDPDAGAVPGAGAGAAGDGSVTTIDVFHRFRVRRDGVDVTPGGMPGRLLKVLAVNGGVLHVEEVVETLWPDVPASRARPRLRNVLSRLRATAGGIVERDEDVLRVTDGVAIDARAFEETATRALAARRSGSGDSMALAREALALVTGPMLPSEPYADWAIAPRERLERLLVQVLDCHAMATADAGGTDEAVQLLERAIEVEPYNEQRYLRLAEVQRAAGRMGAAAQTLRRGMRVLEDLGVPLSRAFTSATENLRSPG